MFIFSVDSMSTHRLMALVFKAGIGGLEAMPFVVCGWSLPQLLAAARLAASRR